MLIAIIFFPSLLLYTKLMMLAILTNLTKEMAANPLYLNLPSPIMHKAALLSGKKKQKKNKKKNGEMKTNEWN